MTHLLLLIVIALSLAGAASGAVALTLGDRRFEARLAARRPPGPDAGAALQPLARALRARITRGLAAWGGRAGRGSLDTAARGALRDQLVQAGFFGERAAEVFFGVRAAAAAALAGAGLAIALPAALGPLWVAALVLGLANVGLFGPVAWLRRRLAQRAGAIARGLPDAVDLLVVAVEAGATVPAAVQRVVAEFHDLHPELCQLLAMMLAEMQAGASRAEALSRLARRAPAQQVRGLSTLLIQSDAVGASLGGALRTASEEIRKARYLDAERRAAELPVKLAFPLVFGIFPSLVGVIFIPIVILFARTLLSA
ncbi:type II secretion system F family protein [Phenylobacterium sp.]|uniref:type II secretion system F family protein n=1 Tax=Phenylobacterium sp. TaxID=1871053 RepID=UPI002CBFBCA2|nr:type II secretion system F family protein [Phenylobacterium sp.]HVI31063.1 type II secretion system F family protein [Phenylobacterium sp.]